MGIDRQTDSIADLQIGPTNEGMVRLYVAGDGIDLPMDFTPEDAREIAEEILAAAEIAGGTQGGRAAGRHGRR
jgi:hypothetical protein